MNLRSVKNLLKIWTKFEDVLDTFQPQSRRGNANSLLASNLSASFHDAENHHEACRSIFQKIDRPWPPKALVEDMLASGLVATGERHPQWGNSND
jgi:hypothetical protein